MCLCQSELLGPCRQARKSRRFNIPLGVHDNPVFRTWCKYRRIYSYNMFGFELSFKKLKIYPQKKTFKTFMIGLLFSLIYSHVYLFICLMLYFCLFFCFLFYIIIFFWGDVFVCFLFCFCLLVCSCFFFFLFVCFLLFFFSWLNFYFIIWISSTKTIVKANRNALQTIHYMLNIEYIIYVYT